MQLHSSDGRKYIKIRRVHKKLRELKTVLCWWLVRFHHIEMQDIENVKYKSDFILSIFLPCKQFI
jgi:hypothetical protein